MGYIALYRKYRPANLQEVVGQKFIVQTLINALLERQIHHAYLFCGPRGTGKTSIARAFAKSINCHEGPTPEPCEKCISCLRNQKGNSLDVVEIDAASNRGIDEIRALKEVVSFSPNEGRYKVYIIDEVHMLTKGAFNAFLKTLEEPPPNVVFLLATTEPHQVLPTILSRCQRFDFRLLSRKEIVDHLGNICEKEGVRAEPTALEVIAISANGGLRDAISILDQAIAFGKGEVKEADVYDFLGKVDHKSLEEIVQAAIQGDTQNLLALMGAAAEGGKAPQQLLIDLTNYIRDALIIKECGLDTPLVELTREVKEGIASGMQKISRHTLLAILGILTDMSREIKFSTHPYLLLELLGVKISALVKENYLERIIALEEKIAKLENQKGLRQQANTEVREIRGVPLQTPKPVVEQKGRPGTSIINESEKNVGKVEPAKEIKSSSRDIPHESVDEGWSGFLQYIQEQRNVRLTALLDKVVLEGTKDDTIFLGLDYPWRQEALQQQREVLERYLQNYFKKSLALSFTVLETKVQTKTQERSNKDNNYQETPTRGATIEGTAASQRTSRSDIRGKKIDQSEQGSISSALKENPLVQEVIKMFDGEIIEE